MGKQRYRDKGKQGLTVKKRAGRRTFGYQNPPEVAAQLPLRTTVKVVSLTKAEVDALARRVEPEVTGSPSIFGIAEFIGPNGTFFSCSKTCPIPHYRRVFPKCEDDPLFS